MQSRDRDTDVQNKCMDTKRERRDGMKWELGTDVYAPLRVKQVTNENGLHSIENSTQCPVVT